MFPLASFYWHAGTCLSLPLLHSLMAEGFILCGFCFPHIFSQTRLFSNSHFSILFWQKSWVTSYLLIVTCADMCWIAMSFSRKQIARLMIWWNRSILCRRDIFLSYEVLLCFVVQLPVHKPATEWDSIFASSIFFNGKRTNRTLMVQWPGRCSAR